MYNPSQPLSYFLFSPGIKVTYSFCLPAIKHVFGINLVVGHRKVFGHQQSTTLQQVVSAGISLISGCLRCIVLQQMYSRNRHRLEASTVDSFSSDVLLK